MKQPRSFKKLIAHTRVEVQKVKETEKDRLILELQALIKILKQGPLSWFRITIEDTNRYSLILNNLRVYRVVWTLNEWVFEPINQSFNIFQYLYWKQMANAATVIQNKYRTYCENKRFKKSKDAAMCIQSYYRTYKEHQTGRSSIRSSRESTPSTSAGLK